MLDQLNTMETAEREEKYFAVMQWIAGAHTELDHDRACGVWREDLSSGRWILRNPALERWKGADTTASSILWLNGIPGAGTLTLKAVLYARLLYPGKTILASVIIEDCMRDKSFMTSFFYCKHDFPEKNSCNAILKSLLNQLVGKCRDLVPYCHDKYLASGELKLVSFNLAKQLLDLFCERLQKMYIIIDGLDECDIAERKLILSCVNSILEKNDARDPGRIRVLFVSQDENDIKEALPTAAVIALGPTDNEDDIRSFVRRSTTKIQLKHELDDKQAVYIMDTTCARARGMTLTNIARTILINS